MITFQKIKERVIDYKVSNAGYECLSVTKHKVYHNKKTQNISKFNRGNIIILAPKHAKKII